MGGRVLALMMLVLLTTGCSAGGSEPSTPTEAASPPDEPLTREAVEEALTRFVDAAGRGDSGALWGHVSARTRDRFVSEADFAAAGLDDGLAAFARAGGYEIVLAEPVSLDWSVAAVARGEEAYAFPFRLEEGGWRVALGGAIALRALAPDPGAVKGRHVQVAVEISAEEAPVGFGVLYLDGETVPAREGGTDLLNVTVYGNAGGELEPGRHVAAAFAQAGDDASAVAWVFSVDEGRTNLDERLSVPTG